MIKESLGALPAFSAAAMRFSVAAVVFTLLAPALSRREGGATPGAALSLVMGLLNFGISYGIVYWGEQILPSGLASVLWATFPLMVALLGHFTLPAERLAPRQWIGFVVAFSGIILLFVKDLAAIGPEARFVGLVFLLSPFSAAIGQVVVKRYAAQVSSALLNRNGMWIGAASLWSVALWREDVTAIVLTSGGAASILYLALFGTVTTFGLYYWLLRHTTANGMSLIAYITPVAAVFLGSWLGDEALTSSLAIGASLVLAGLTLTKLRA